MKVDRSKPAHWFLLVGFFLQAGLGILWRTVGRKPLKRTVVLYGHQLNGNLLALYRYMINHPETGLRPVFLTMDQAYCRELQGRAVEACWASGPDGSTLLARAGAVVSDHGLHSLQFWRRLYQRSGLRFFDVWHGIPFKGFDPNDFRVQQAYDEVWVASELNRGLYTSRFGFAAERVVATGYARTDRLIEAAGEDKAEIRVSLGLPVSKKLILFAPTWAQDFAGRNLFPFGCDGRMFLGTVAKTAAKLNAGLVLRTHRNSGNIELNDCQNVHILPASRYSDTETVLLACDVLVCDWSSIAFDFLLLNRPAIFLDVEPPFQKGFSLGPEYRYGAVVDSLEMLSEALEQSITQSDSYWHAHADRHRDIKRQVYGGLADGNASQRCVHRLKRVLWEDVGASS